MKIRFLAAAALFGLLLAISGAATEARADNIEINSTVVGGGPAADAYYVNFNDLTPTNLTTGVGAVVTTAEYQNQAQVGISTIGVSLSPDAQVVSISSPNLYAAPYLSGQNGTPFGSTGFTGVDNTTYITSGSDNPAGNNTLASATLNFGASQNYFGILWGSVDSYNTLTFYNGSTANPSNIVGTITGDQVKHSPTGDQGVNGTSYVNIVDTTASFTSVVATSSQFAFEFDNVAFGTYENPTDLPAITPEPSIVAMLATGAPLGLGFWCWNRRRAA